MSLFRDWRGQFSWGRFCALVALVVAVVGQWTGMTVEATKLWLAVAVGNYGVSKLTEAVALMRKVGVAAPPAASQPSGCVEGGSAKIGGSSL